MARTIVLSEYQLDDFQAVLDVGPEALRKAVERLRKDPPAPLTPDKLALAVAEGLETRNGAAASIVRQALMLEGWIMQEELEVTELLVELRDALKVDFDWADAKLEKWKSIEPALGDLLSLPIFRLAAVARDLSVGTDQTFVSRAACLDREGQTDSALDIIYDSIDELMRNGAFPQLDSVLSGIDVSALSADILLGILTATLPARSRLGARPGLYMEIEKALRDRGEYEDGLLTGLGT